MSASTQTRAMEGDLSRISAIVKMGKDAHRKDTASTYTEYDSLFQGDDSEAKRKGNYTKMVNHFYDLATDFYEYGWGHSFHFATRHKWETFEASIARHEMWIAHKLNAHPGDRILDVGCGIGGPLRAIARFSGAHVVGLNNNDYQINRAKTLNQEAAIKNASFLKADFMKIPQDDNTYDGVYEIEATCHAPDKVGVYKEIMRVLKPGQLFAGYEWIMTPNYDPNDPEHVSIKKGIEIGNGLPDIESGDDIVKHLKKAGFEILETRDLAPTSDIPWYVSLSPSVSFTGFMHTGLGRWTTGWMVYLLEKSHIAPQGISNTHEMLQAAATNLVLGGKKEIFSPMFFTLCRKPANAK